MAVRITGTGVYLARTATLPDVAAFTICGWAKLGTERDWAALFDMDNADTLWLQLALNDTSPTRGLAYSVNGAQGASFNTRPDNATWFFFAISHVPGTNGMHGYWGYQGGSLVTLTRDGISDFAPTGLYLGNDGFNDYGDCAFSHVRLWDAALNQTEIEAEFASGTVVRTANLHLNTPLASHTDLSDISGNGRGWTGNGTLSTETGPSFGGGGLTINANAVSSSAAVYQPALTFGSITVSANAVASSAAVYAPAVRVTQTIEGSAVASSAAVYPPSVTPAGASQTINANAVASTAAGYAPQVTVGSITIVANIVASSAVVRAPELRMGACIGGVLTVDATNPRYFAVGGAPLLLAGFPTWYSVQDGGATDPPPAFDWDEYLAALVSYGCNFTKLWAMETGRGWSDVTNQWFSPPRYARTGPGNDNDGKLKFDLTQVNAAYLARLRARAVEAGNAGLYVCVQLFQGWQVEVNKGGTGDPASYHPYLLANNINSLDGDANDDGSLIETHTNVSNNAWAYQQDLVEAIIDALGDLDHVIWEISNEDTGSAANTAWQTALISHIQTYEAGKPKQHLIGMTVQYPNGNNTTLDNSGADWVSYNGDKANAVHGATDPVSAYDTDHTVGLTDQYAWALQAFCNGHGGVWYMDEWDGTLYGNDRRSNATYQLIRRVVGDVLGYAAQMDLANATPQTALSSTGYCLAKTTGSAQLFAYQGGTGNFTVDLSSLSGVFDVEWYRVSDGATQAGSDVNGGAIRTLTPPWAGAVAAYLAQAALLIEPNAVASGTAVYAPALTFGSITVQPNAAASGSQVYAPSVQPQAITVGLNAVASSATVYAPQVTVGSVTVVALAVESGASVYAPSLSMGAITVSLARVESAAVVYEPVVSQGQIIVLAARVESGAVVYAPSVQPGAVAISVQPVAASSAVYAPSLSFGSITVVPEAVAGSAQVYAPTLTQGAVVRPDSVASSAVVYAPGLSLGAITVSANRVESSATVYAPSIQPGNITVAPQTAIGSAAVYAPQVTILALVVRPAAVDSAAQVYAPSLTFGPVTVAPNLVESGATVYAPAVYVASELAIRPETVASTAAVYIPASVVIFVAVAVRTMRADSAPRVVSVAAPGRVVSVAAPGRSVSSR